MNYEDLDLLTFKDYIVEPFEDRMRLEEDPIVYTPDEWELGLDKSGLLGLIHMPHFG